MDKENYKSIIQISVYGAIVAFGRTKERKGIGMER